MADRVVFEATIIKPLDTRRSPEGFRHVWGHCLRTEVGLKLFAYRWEHNGEINYRCYTPYKDCFNLSEDLAKTILRATRTPDGRLKPLSTAQQVDYEKRVRDIDWELHR
jgi:hypothetical protein